MSEENKTEATGKVMKIKHLTIQNVKAVNCIDCDIPLSGVTTFGGRNNQGKTTVLTGIQYGLGGENYRPTNYPKDNANGDTFMDILFEDGLRVVRLGDTADLKVIDETGKLQGQTLLNKFISKMALDFPKFINGTDRERRDILLTALNLKAEVDAIEDVIESEYQERTVIGRIAEQKDKAVKEMPFYEGVPADEISTADVMKRLREVEVRNAKAIAAKQEIDGLNSRLVRLVETGDNLAKQKDSILEDLKKNRSAVYAEIEDERKRLNERIAALQNELTALSAKEDAKLKQVEESWLKAKAVNEESIKNNESEIAELTDKIAAAEQGGDVTIEDTSSFQKELDSITDINGKIRANKVREEAKRDAIEQRRKYDEKTAVIEQKRHELDALLVGADLPYPGLTVENRVIHLNGKAWDCMSESMKIRVGCAIVSRINPACKFMLVDKLEQLDSESLAELDQFAKDHNLQIIGTRVTNNPDDCTIIIKNGWIAGMEEKMLEMPSVNRRKGSKKGAAKSAATTEAELPLDEPKDTNPIVNAAYKGEETDAMRRAKELIAKKREQIKAASTVEG